jgi:hypothetical protein
VWNAVYSDEFMTGNYEEITKPVEGKKLRSVSAASETGLCMV